MSYKLNQICRKISVLAALLLLLQVAIAQYDFNKVDAWLKNNLDEFGGRAVLVVYKDGKPVYTRIANEINKRQQRIIKFIAKRKGKDAEKLLEDFDMNSQQMIASCSKWPSAALVMTFVDEGKLSLTDTIGKYLPVMTSNGKGNITIWQCLSHLTGIEPGNLKESMQMILLAPSMKDVIDTIARQPMEGDPGKTFHYSNVGLQIAAAVIEKISGKNFESLFQERIARPCNMVNSTYGTGKTILAAGSCRSSPQDFIHFLTMLLNDGMFNGKIVLKQSSVIEMQKNRVAADTKIAYSPAEAGNWGYGFGEWVMDNPLLVPAKKGDMPGSIRSNAVTSPGLFGSFPWVNNEKKYAGFLFVFNIKNKGRNQRYKELKNLVDEVIIK